MTMALAVNIVCRNWRDDRVLPRFARHLSDRLGWVLTAGPNLKAPVIYLMGYFEAQLFGRWPQGIPVAAYFTHREEEPPGNDKGKFFDTVARQCQLRVAMSRMYADQLSKHGTTMQPPLPLERDRFVIADAPKGRRPVVGFSGYTYKNHRKGEDLVNGVIKSKSGGRCEWMASGRGWPVPTRRYTWKDMPKFFQGLNVLVCPSRVEGGPMPALEALACGVRVVIPTHVGILDEIPNAPGIHRYKRGNLESLVQALERALDEPFDREALRAATVSFSVEAFCECHQISFDHFFEGL